MIEAKLASEIEAAQTARILKTVAITLGLKIHELAESLGVNRQQMYDYTMGKKVPKWPFWVNLKRQYPNLSGDYLLTGVGSPLL